MVEATEKHCVAAFTPDGLQIVSGGGCPESYADWSKGGTITIWGFRPFENSEWVEVVQNGPDSRSYPDLGGYQLGFPYWKNKVNLELEKHKPTGSEHLRLEYDQRGHD